MSDNFVAKAEHVTRHYGKTLGLNGVAMEIPCRCMVGMIGPNGVGKSILLGL